MDLKITQTILDDEEQESQPTPPPLSQPLKTGNPPPLIPTFAKHTNPLPFNSQSPPEPIKQNPSPPPNFINQAMLKKKTSEQSPKTFFGIPQKTQSVKRSFQDSPSSYQETNIINKVDYRNYEQPSGKRMVDVEDSVDYSPKANFVCPTSYHDKHNAAMVPNNNMVTESIQNMDIPVAGDPPGKKPKIKILSEIKYENPPLDSPQDTQTSTKRQPHKDLFSNPNNHYSTQQSFEAKNIRQQFSAQRFNLTERQDWIKDIDNPKLEWRLSKDSPLQIKIMLKQLSTQASPNTVSQLQKTVAVSEPLPLSSRFSEYSKQSQIRKWAKDFPVYRKIRGDGNCFYRAFVFSFLEMALTHQSSIYFLKFLSAISNKNKVSFETDRKNRMINNNDEITAGSMRAFVIHRLLLLYSYRVTLAESGDPKWEQKIINVLEQVFNEPPYCFDTFLIIAIKNYTIYELQHMEVQLDEDQMRSVKSEILSFGAECELNQFPINALSSGLQVCISLYQEYRGNFKFDSYGDKRREKIILYFRPGHYDLVYPYKEVYKKVVGGN